MSSGSTSNGKLGAVVGALVLALATAGTASGATGTAGATIGHLVEITATDASVATLTVTPANGVDQVAYTTSDGLTFSNAQSNLQAAWDLAVTVSFTYASDGSTSTTTVDHSGVTTTLADLVHLTQSSGGQFTPWKLQGTDLSGDGQTWTAHADCGVETYRGSFTVASYSNTGSAQADTTRYYQVCDATELYLGTTRDLSAADAAHLITSASVGASATAANYEVTILGNDYVFYSAASASTVTLRQGMHVALGADSNTASMYPLFSFPQGFPAGSYTATVTSTATDIVT